MAETRDNELSDLEVYKLYAGWVGGRMSHCWKISLALWSSLGFILGLLASGKADWLSRAFIEAGVVAAALVAVAYLYWVWMIALHNRHDVEQMRACTKRHLDAKGVTFPEQGKWLRRYYSQVLQAAITVALLFLVVVAAVTGPERSSNSKTENGATSQPQASVHVDMTVGR